MPQDYNLAFAVLQRALESPQAPAIRSPESDLPYGQLRARILRYATQMQVRGIGRGSCVALSIQQPADAVALGLGLSLLGASWVDFDPIMPLRALGVTHMIAARSIEGVSGPRVYTLDASWLEFPAGVDPAQGIGFEGFALPSDPLNFGRSSGTTGEPKYMANSAAASWAQIAALFRGSEAVVQAIFPALSGMGFSVMVGAFLRGATVVVGAGTLQAMVAAGVRRLYASPAQLDRLCSGPPAARKIGSVCAVGSIMRPAMIRTWLRDFELVELWYGSSEAGHLGGMRVTAIEPGDDIAYTLDEGVSSEVVDTDGKAVPPGVIGAIRVKTPWIVGRYIGAPEASAEVFRDGWVYPGDLGTLTPDGRLKVEGRVKDQFNVGGVKVGADKVDAAVTTAAGVQRAVAFMRLGQDGRDALCVLAVLAAGVQPEQAASAIRSACGSILAPGLTPSSIYFADELPLGGTGKPLRETARGLSQGLTPF